MWRLERCNIPTVQPVLHHLLRLTSVRCRGKTLVDFRVPVGAPVFHYHQVNDSRDQGINIFWYFLGPVTWKSRLTTFAGGQLEIPGPGGLEIG